MKHQSSPDENVDRIVDMALRMAGDYGAGGNRGEGADKSKKKNPRQVEKGRSMEKYVTSENRR